MCTLGPSSSSHLAIENGLQSILNLAALPKCGIIRPMNKAIITVVGKDTVGILAKTCTCLAENGVNILDISQTVVQDYFNMMMIVDMSGATKAFADVGADLA